MAAILGCRRRHSQASARLITVLHFERNTLTGISLIIPQHGRCDLTLAAVSSLQAAHSVEPEIIVVDDGSPPSQVRYLQQHLARPLQLLRLDRRQGVTAAWNHGAAAARGEVLIFLNNDTQTLGPWLEQFTAPLLEGNARLCGLEWRSEPELPLPERQVLAGWCLALRRHTWERCGGFDERFRLYYSDTDLQQRVRNGNPEALHAVAGLPITHIGKATTRACAVRSQEWQRDRKRFRQKWQ